MELQVNGGGLGSFLAVPTDIVDKHLSTASGIYIKVLLAVLRANRVDTAQIARKLSIPESDVTEAVGYWVQNGVFTTVEAQSKPQKAEPQVVVTAQSLSTGEIAERMNRNPDIQFLFHAVEEMMGNVLTSTQQRTLIFIHESYGLPVDVIVMAVEYCFSIGKNSFSYIQRLCNGWADQGINTHALAEETLRKLNQRKNSEHQIIELLGLGDRPLTSEQQRYLQTWLEKYGYGLEMIQIAYERTLNSINKLSLPYMNSILKSWYEKNIRTPADVAAKDTRNSVRISSGQQKGWDPSYDIQELERRGLSIPKFD
ncbi:MAG: DnaD domain protein [Candidatus Merdivicinus sp.]